MALIKKFVNSVTLSYYYFAINEVINHAAALTFYFLLSFIPILLLSTIFIRTFLSGYPFIESDFFDLINKIDPELMKYFMKVKLLDIEHSINFGVLGFISLSLSSVLFTRSILRAFNIIYTTPKSKIILGFFMPFILNFFTIIFIIFFILAKIIIEILVGYITVPLLSEYLNMLKSFMGNTLFPIIAITLITTIYYISLSWKRISTMTAIIGGFLFTFSIFVVNILFYKVFSLAKYNLIYGSLGTLIFSLFWLYVVFLLFMFFAQFTYVIYNYDFLMLRIFVENLLGSNSFITKLVLNGRSYITNKYCLEYKVDEILIMGRTVYYDTYLICEGMVQLLRGSEEVGIFNAKDILFLDKYKTEENEDIKIRILEDTIALRIGTKDLDRIVHVSKGVRDIMIERAFSI